MNVPTARATDTLANERTYLAYVRTALSFVAFGFVIARFSLFLRELSHIANIPIPNRQASTIFGSTMAIAGIVVGIYGTYRYVVTNSALQRNENAPLAPAAAVAGGILIAAIGLVVAIDLLAFG
jgi:putative membrane protein